MKKHVLFLLSLVCLEYGTRAQTNSVDLKDAFGSLLSQHNTISAAYAAIPSTITQAYVIELSSAYTAANETYPMSLGVKTGSSSTNTITIMPAASVTNPISLASSVAAGNLFTLNDADYVIIDGRPGGTGTTRMLTFSNTGNSGSNTNTISFINGATFNVIRYCNIRNITTTNTGRVIAFGTSASNTSGNSDNSIEHCYFPAMGRYGINTNGTAANPNTRNKIYGCEMVNPVFAGLWYQSGSAKMIIDSNVFYSNASPSVGDAPTALLFDSQADTVIISRNHFYNITASNNTAAVKAINVRSVLVGNYTLIYNNFISLGGVNPGSTTVTGIEYGGTVLTKADIFHNTISITGALTSGGTSGSVVSTPFLKSASNVGSVYNIKNNIFMNSRTGGNTGAQHLCLAITSNTGTINMDYNTYNSSSGNITRLATTVHTTLASWQTAASPNETNTNMEPVVTLSATDLHLVGSSYNNFNLSAPLGSIFSDIDNEVRNFTYRGADEAQFLVPVKLSYFNASAAKSDVHLTWATASEKGSDRFIVEVSTDNKAFSSIGEVMASRNSSVTKSYQLTHNDAWRLVKHSGVLYYRLKLVDQDGASEYSKISKVTSVADQNKQLSVSPNPFTDKVSFDLQLPEGTIYSIGIMNMQGRLVKTITGETKSGASSVYIDGLSALSPGIYFTTITYGNEVKTGKLVKQ